MNNTEYLILVDEEDRQWGKLEKELIHELGLLHRAFSVFIFNSNGELLLQQRADEKYHSGGLWTNTCCSHPQYGEELDYAVERRLEEEMGMKAETQFAFSFLYKVKFDNGLSENEFDHVFFGFSDQEPKPAQAEVQDWKYISISDLSHDLILYPEKYTVWLRICFNRLISFIESSDKVKSKIKFRNHVSL